LSFKEVFELFHLKEALRAFFLFPALPDGILQFHKAGPFIELLVRLRGKNFGVL
jgi:tRNA U34 5-methylaminomethyl-2-thiouridine-forming methyltransferase MnmC